MAKVVKSIKSCKLAHTPKSSKGMGDYQGTAIKNPMGKVRDGLGFQNLSPKKIKIPPKSLA